MHPNFIPTFPQLFRNRPQLLAFSGCGGCGTATESWGHRNHTKPLYLSALCFRLRSVAVVAVFLATSRIFHIFFSKSNNNIMAPNFKRIQQVYVDALRLRNTLTRADQPIGKDTMLRFLGGGKVLYYEHKGKSETCIVSRIAATEITVIAGPPGSGKFQKVFAMASGSELPCWQTYGWLEGGECIVPEGTDLLIIQKFPDNGRFDRLLSGFIGDKSGKVLPVHVVAVVEHRLPEIAVDFNWKSQFHGHPVEFITLPPK